MRWAAAGETSAMPPAGTTWSPTTRSRRTRRMSSDQRRMHPLRLLDAPLEHRELPQRLDRHLAAGAEHVRLLGADGGRCASCSRRSDSRPRGQDGARVLAGEHGRQQETRDLALAERPPVGVPRAHERLEEVLGLHAARPPLRDDPRDQGRHAGRAPDRGGARTEREARLQEGEEVHAAFEVVVEPRELLGHVAAEVAPDQAAAGDEHGQLVHGAQEVDSPRSPQRSKYASASSCMTRA